MSTVARPRQVTDLFGRIISAAEVEVAVKETIARWINVYLGELELQLGMDYRTLPRPGSYVVASEFDNPEDAALPVVLLVSPGLARSPTAEGDGTYMAGWGVSVAIIASAADERSTNNLVKVYMAAIRAVLIQKRSLGGFAAGIDWLDEQYDSLPAVDDRTFAGGQMDVIVWVDNVVNRQLGPYAWQGPDDVEPGDDYYIAEKVIITINNIRVDEEVNP